MCMTAVVSEKGQVTIPKELRIRLGIGPGSLLNFEEDHGCLVARKKVNEDPVSRWRGKGKLPMGNSVESYIETIRER